MKAVRSDVTSYRVKNRIDSMTWEIEKRKRKHRLHSRG